MTHSTVRSREILLRYKQGAEDSFREDFVDFDMTRDRLRHTISRVVVQVVTTSIAQQYAARGFES
jgi:hypothetical protein